MCKGPSPAPRPFLPPVFDWLQWKPTYCNQSNTGGRKGLGVGLGESMVDVIQVTPECILLVKLLLRDQWLTCIMMSRMRAGIKLQRRTIENVWEFCTPPDNHCCM